jgi:hypothetical protein
VVAVAVVVATAVTMVVVVVMNMIMNMICSHLGDGRKLGGIHRHISETAVGDILGGIHRHVSESAVGGILGGIHRHISDSATASLRSRGAGGSRTAGNSIAIAAPRMGTPGGNGAVTTAKV